MQSQLSQLPQDIVLYGILKYVCISDLPKIALVNKAFNALVQDILFANKYDEILLERIDNNIHKHMTECVITYSDITRSSIRTSLFDQLILLVSMQASKQIGYMDIIFNYSIVCKKYINKNTPTIQSDKLIIQTDVFDYSVKSCISTDFKVFQLAFYIIENHLEGRPLELVKVSLLSQMIKYFQMHFFSTLDSLCSDDVYNVLRYMSNVTLEYYNKMLIRVLTNISIYKLDINLYYVYYVMMVCLIRKKYKSLMPTSMYNELSESLFDNVYVKSLYKENSKMSMQTETMNMLIQCCASVYETRVYIVFTLFTYLNNIIDKDYMTQTYRTILTKLLKTMYEKAVNFIEDLETSDNHDEKTKKTGADILQYTIKMLNEFI